MTQGANLENFMDLEITDLSRGGAGVARAPDGRVIFVPLTAPGDLVRVRFPEIRKKSEKRYVQAELMEILRASPDRQAPRCPVFGRCGGCQWQHLPYEIQWKTKRQGVAHALARAGVEPGIPIEELPAERIWEYRNRIQLRGNGREIGFFALGSRSRVPVDRCDIARPEINARWESLREKGSKLSAETSGKDYKVEIEVLENGETREAWNQGHAALGFRQVHDEQNTRLQSWVMDALADHEGGLFDLFGGNGNLSLPFAKANPSRQYHCVDLSVPDWKSGNYPQNLRFHRFAVLKWVLRQKRLPGEWAAILDPPREGLAENHAEIASALERLGTEKILAVGCDTDAWVRDVRRWLDRGWKLQRWAALDLFPQTPHVESLALLVL